MRILLVEDEEKVSRFVGRRLAEEAFATDVARDAAAGLEMATTYQYDLIILDLLLPGLSGTEVLRRLRRMNPQVPVLVLTARDAVSDKVENFEAGADDYLTKPFAFAEVLVRVKALLRRGPVARESVLRVVDLELDRLTQQVRRAGKRIELTAKEYALLEYLMANAGRVLSRTMIIEHYAPEINGRYVRVTRGDRSVLYASGAPEDRSFGPVGMPPAATISEAQWREEHLAGGGELLVYALSFTSRNLGERLPVAHTGDELERLAVSLNRMVARLEEAFTQVR